MSGPITPVSAWPDVTPHTPMLTAMASSKLFPAEVNATVAERAYGNPIAWDAHIAANHMSAK